MAKYAKRNYFVEMIHYGQKMPLPSSLRVNERSFFFFKENRHVELPFVHGCYFWSVLRKKFGFCAAKLLETPRYLADLARFLHSRQWAYRTLAHKGCGTADLAQC